MLLLLIDSLLLIFITFSLGSMSRSLLGKVFGWQLQLSFPERFIIGLIFQSVYFNIVSLFIPVNFLVLIPLLLITIYRQWRNNELSFAAFSSWIQRWFPSAAHKALLFGFMLLIGFHFLIPPVNHDSADYHYHAVYWYENYKVITGLGNVHGRLGFNAINFILSAPYSFTHVAGQSLYPLNGVLVMVFYLWLLQNIMRKQKMWSAIAYLVTAILLLRPLLSNIPSPASEPLVTVAVSLVFFRLMDVIEQKQHNNIACVFGPIIISFFAITAKLTALPLLVVPIIWMVFFLKMKPSVYLGGMLLVLLMMIPWLARNVILSGYLLYPLYQLDLFNVDWKVPKDVAVLDYAFGTIASRGDLYKVINLDGFFNWFPLWVQKHLVLRRMFDFSTFLLALSSMIVWIIVWRKKIVNRLLFILWLCSFAGLLVWLFQAPEFRFGMGFILLAFCIPLINLGNVHPINQKNFKAISISLTLCTLLYYGVRSIAAHPRFHTNGIETLWLKPMKDERYYIPFDTATARIEDLGYGIKVYYQDATHDVIHIYDQPCMKWDIGKITLRGKTIEQGFKNTRVTTRTTIPFLFKREW